MSGLIQQKSTSTTRLKHTKKRAFLGSFQMEEEVGFFLTRSHVTAIPRFAMRLHLKRKKLQPQLARATHENENSLHQHTK